jgi:uncharacterized protein with gpF-like domain
MTVVKRWMATNDDRTRDDHRELNDAVVVGFETPFETASGDQIRWPHDPGAPGRQVINCRCVITCRLIPRSAASQFMADNPVEPVTTDA